jgi:hypothetical protein
MQLFSHARAALRRSLGLGLAASGLVLCLPLGSAWALSVTDSNFDQIAKIVSAGGTATQIGGASPGKNLTNSGDFDGTAGTQTGVAVSLPDYTFVQSVPALNDGGSTEPGNTASMLLGSPTDMTFTTPGSGGPDGGPGDGSVQIVGGGGSVTLSFDQDFTAGGGETEDILLFTNTNSFNPMSMDYGEATVELLDNTLSLINYMGTDQKLDVMIPMGVAGSGMGGVTLDVPDGVTFYALRITPLSGNAVEIDGAAVIPEPATALLLAGGLAALAAWRSRRS